ncbi:voltage-gated potassium channel beta-2 subunit [Coniochaeta ligniaria NRRL 30616]|uniref:Voltage-gated potassium channel beta-2 subunit n=1 Tax=Coniochaeta ligniaria NRRL 30616 TaxID=1408157 RepID=A0A1J7JX17_9PEZI|nr:voltage-gated potassium channel beta-2 subunit [Coniochaeta ligniaria NRRL 30616]
MSQSARTFNPGKMQYRFLGRTGLKVSALSFGSWVTVGGQVGQDTSKKCMLEAWNNGVNYFDTAEVYASGECEKVFGQALKELNFKRSDIVVSTKLFWGGPGPNDTGLSKKHLFEGMRASLKRLDLEYVDIVMAHRPDALTPMEEIVRAFTEIVQSGQALYWGTSEWKAHDIERAHHMAAVHHLIPPMCDQPQYNAFWRDRVEDELRPVLRNYGYGLTIWSPLDNGVLTGKYNDGIPQGSRLTGADAADSDKQNMINFGKALSTEAGQAKIAKVRKLTDMAKDLGCSTAQLALAWCLSNEQVSTVITGASRPEQVTENMKALDIYDIMKKDPSIKEKMDKILDNTPEAEELFGRWA